MTQAIVPTWVSETSIGEGEDAEHWTNLPQFTLPLWRRRELKQNMKSVHTKFKVEGDARKVRLFHRVLRAVDRDYPLAPDTSHALYCPSCHGVHWPTAAIEPEAMKRAARQCEVRLLIKHYHPSDRCSGTLERKPVA